MNLKPAFRYQLGNYLRASVVFYLIVILVIAAFMIGVVQISAGSSSTFSYTGGAMALTIFMFILGIVNIRGDMRLCLQFGVSRRTAFISGLLAVAIISVVLSVAAELLTGVAQLATENRSNFICADLYQVLYVGVDIKTLTFAQHSLSVLFNTGLMVVSCFSGMFFSLVFWRLNKVFTIIVAVSIPIILNLVPILLYQADISLMPFWNWLMSSLLNFILCLLLLAAVVSTVNWALLRRANIKPAK